MVPRQEPNTFVSPDMPCLSSPGFRTALEELYLRIPGMQGSACARLQECQQRVTHGSRDVPGECRGCHGRKHGDTTCPSGGTEADRAGMRLCDPRGIWLRRQGVLSSFLRQREEESGADLAVGVLSDGTERHQQTLRFGERWIPAHSPAPALCPEGHLAEGERASESFQGHTAVGEGDTCQGLPEAQQMPEGQANWVCRLQGPFMSSFFNVNRSFPLKEVQVFNLKIPLSPK